MIRYLVLIALGSLLVQSSLAQKRPDWTQEITFEDYPNSYIEVVDATGNSEDNAIMNAKNVIVKRRSLASGEEAKIIGKDDDVSVEIKHDVIVKARIIAKYSEQIQPGLYQVYLLVQTLRNSSYSYENIKVTKQYPFSPRAFVPGMAQLHKGNTTKSVIFIAGETVAIGGIVAFEGLRSSKRSKIKTTHDVTTRKKYMNDASNMKNIRNGFIAGAVAIYLWNIIDGMAAKGKEHLVIKQSRLCVMPYALPESAGVNLCLIF